MKAAAEIMDTAEKPQSILHVQIDNMIYPITLEVIHKVYICTITVFSLL